MTASFFSNRFRAWICISFSFYSPSFRNQFSIRPAAGLAFMPSSSLPSASSHTAAASAAPPPSSSSLPSIPSTSLGAHALRRLVVDAARADGRDSLDVPGIAWMEHVNLVVGSMDVARMFYVDFLGLTVDDNPKHVNLGQQQFHLAATDDPPQRISGSIGLAVPTLETIRSRASAARSALDGTEFAILTDDPNAGIMTVRCPWGNVFHLYDIARDEQSDSIAPEGGHGHGHPAPEYANKMTKLHADGQAYGPHKMAVRGGPGIRFVEVSCAPGTARAVARFYERMLGCSVTEATMPTRDDAAGNGPPSASAAAAVCVGPGVHLAYVERDDLSDGAIAGMEGVHLCVYASNFKGLHDRLKERDLVWKNPRFLYLDSCGTWEEAYASRTLRFKDMIDLNTGEKVLELEHETRPMRHGQYLKVPKYTPR